MKKQKDPACFKCWDKGYSSIYNGQEAETKYCDCPAGEKAQKEGKQAKLI